MNCSRRSTIRYHADVVWLEDSLQAAAKQAYSIGEIAKEFDISPRALRFYESRGLITPARNGRQRLYGQEERERLGLILQAKKLGFTILEISKMIEAGGGAQSSTALRLTHETCANQIALLERQRADIDRALTELRGLHRVLSRSKPEKP